MICSEGPKAELSGVFGFPPWYAKRNWSKPCLCKWGIKFLLLAQGQQRQHVVLGCAVLVTKEVFEFWLADSAFEAEGLVLWLIAVGDV